MAVMAVVVVAGLSAGCSESASAKGSSAAGRMEAAPAPGSAPGGGLSGDAAPGQPAAPPSGQNSNLAKAPVAGRSLVYTATLTVRTKDVAGATSNAETLATANGGFVGTEIFWAQWWDARSGRMALSGKERQFTTGRRRLKDPS